MKVLLVRLSSMGDLVHVLPAVQDLSRQRSDITLHWLCEKAFMDIAKLHSFVQKIHIMQWRYWRKHLFSQQTWQDIGALKATLQAEQYDLVLDIHGYLKSAVFAHMANVPVTGPDRHSTKEPLSNLWYTHKLSVDISRDLVWYNRSMMAKCFGYELDPHSKADFGVHLAKQNINIPTPFHLALTATSQDRKLWHEDSWRALFLKMYQYDSTPIYLPFGNQTEHERAVRLSQGLDFVHCCEPMSIAQMAQVIAQSCSVIGLDTGLLHLANALNRPAIGLFTVTDPHKAGIQPSDITDNIGGLGKIPTVDEVFQVWSKVNHRVFYR